MVQGFVVRGEWVKMTDFLKAVEEPRAHTKLYLDGKTPLKVWKVGSKLPRVKKHWDMLKGPHGGGTGDGLPHARAAFLKQVWAKYYLAGS